MRLLLLTSVLILFNLTQIYSQLKDSCCQNYSVNSYVRQGDFSAGITAGYSFKSQVPYYGFNSDYYLYQLRTGIISAGVIGKYNSGSEEIFSSGSKLKTSSLTAGLSGKLYFNRIGISSVIPFAGMVLGYNYSDTKYIINDPYNKYFPDTHKHSFYFLGMAGLDFYINKNFAFNLIFSSGNIEKGIIEGGISFKF